MMNKFSKLIFVLVILGSCFLFAKSASAATYYMRADGTAADKTAATSCDDSSTSMNVTTHNASTFSAGDTIYVCGNGGNYTTQLTNPSSGTSGSPISYVGTSTPTWNMVSRNWYTNGKDYLIIDGMTFNNTTSGYSIQMTTSDYSTLKNITSVAPSGIYVQTCTSPTLENVTSTASSVDAIRIAGSNIVITNPTILSSNRYGIFLEGVTSATVTGGTISNTQFEGIRITNSNNSTVSISGITLSNTGLNGGATSAGIYYSGASATGGNFTVDDVQITGAGGLGGVYFDSAPFESNRATVSNVNVSASTFGIRGNNSNNIDISNSTFLNNTADGIYFAGNSSGIVINSVKVGNNNRDGISFGDGTTNSTVKNSLVYGSGQTDSTSNGDGITTHTDSIGFNFYNNVIWGNRNSGFALVANSSANIYNNTVYFNGDSTSVNMGVRGGFYNSGSGGIFNVRNNIFFGNYPREINMGSTGDSSVYLASTFDFNQYYHTGNNVDENNFAYIGSGGLDWATYHANYENNSNYGNPLFASAGTDFSLLAGSPAMDTGTDLGTDYDDALLPGSTWPSSVLTGLQSSYGNGWEIGAYIYTFPLSPTIGAPTALSSSAIRWNFTDNTSGETGFRIYDNTNALATSSATANLTYLDETGLSENTQYSGRYATAYNSAGNSAPSSAATAVYTLADTPTNFSASSNSNSVSLSVDSFPNDTSGQSGYYFSRSGANSGWVQTNSWTDSGLSCGHEYTYSVMYRNGDGTETSSISTTKSTSGCGGGGSPAMWSLPTMPSGGFKININGGALTTSNRNVLLGFNAGTDIKKIAISMTGDFTDASQEDYVASKQWDLCSKLGGAIKNPTCPDGTYKVYAQFYTAYGRTTGNAFASSTIVLKSNTPMENLQQTNNLPFTNPFTKYLQFRQTNDDIKRLQIFLNSDPDTKIAVSGAGSPGKETNYFGLLTYRAVIKFQEKYAKDVLAPWGFAKGTGYVGKTTLAKINELIKK